MFQVQKLQHTNSNEHEIVVSLYTTGRLKIAYSSFATTGFCSQKHSPVADELKSFDRNIPALRGIDLVEEEEERHARRVEQEQ